ncbi:uncharacterized protein LOC112574811 isoform X2 [Pomacea canaliculata]|uniref:uncharacterized protein LOC112574811 isoform X2 n=1 Tax=Pomacea canaliculata TaxID=400727 RepID=UPI000D739F97|nr:uncharacterized protein LOC112574811 isoform X2 [Pomacea canaliculata]
MLRFFVFLLWVSPCVLTKATGSCQGAECLTKTWHNVSCRTKDDCDAHHTTCYRRVCRCHPGYFYTTHYTCTDTCSTDELQDTFTEYPDSALRENLIHSQDGLTLEACKGRCQTDKTCLTFDFKASGGLCRLHNVTAHQSPSYWSPKRSKGWTHYQKSCKSTFASDDTWYNLLCESSIDCPDPHSDCLKGRCQCNIVFDQAEEKCVVANSCLDWQAAGGIKSGVYTIDVRRNEPLAVWCDMDTADGGWTVIQRRRDFTVDFNRNWTEYVNGFGNLTGDFWLGLDAIDKMLTYGLIGTRMRVDLVAEFGKRRFAQYDYFYVSGPEYGYKLAVGYYSGNAGDGLKASYDGTFQTYDRKKDECVTLDVGAWWYPRGCSYQAGLNRDRMVWSDSGFVKFSEMKMKPWS